MTADQRRAAKQARRNARRAKQARREMNRQIARIAGDSPVVEIDAGALMRQRIEAGRWFGIGAIAALVIAIAAIAALLAR